jgi:hypothetical protein
MWKAVFLLALLSLRPLGVAQDHLGKMTPAGSWDMGNGYAVPGVNWEHVTPESVGYSSARLEVLRLAQDPSNHLNDGGIQGKGHL